MTHDVGPMHFVKDINGQPLLRVIPPEPSNSSLLLEELIEDINIMVDVGIQVDHDGRSLCVRLFFSVG